MTSGNHIWDKKEVLEYIRQRAAPAAARQLPGRRTPGKGTYVAQTGDGRAVGIINMMGRVHMPPLDDPFALVLREIEAMRAPARA